MQSAHLKLLAGFAAAAAIVVSTWLPASAGAFNVKPIRVFLSKDGTSTVVTIENQDQNVLRLQVRAYAWTNDRQGKPVLAPTDDLIVFPALVDVNPMERRSIRVAFSGNAAAKELTYRIALDEMPSIESQLSKSNAPGLQVRTRVTIPVFYAPLIASPKAQIAYANLRHGAVQGRISNDGNAHATISAVDVVGRDAQGATVFEKTINGWYVLAGQSWDFSTGVGRACSKIRTLSVSVQSDVGRLQHTTAISPADCR